MTGRADGRADERHAVVAAAVRLFERRGYDATTMGDVAEEAGLSRRSLFRRFGTKEDILFAEHEDLHETVRRFLDAAPGDDPVATVTAAARMVFQGYAAAPDTSVRRFRLVRAVPRLRDREIAMTARYQSAFRRYLAGGERDTERALAAEAVAASVIAAHNHVLRSWLREPDRPVPWDRFDRAMAFVTEGLGDVLRGSPGAGGVGGSGGEVVVAVYPPGTDPDEVARRVRRALDPGDPSAAIDSRGRI
ncbi:TetR/AcrR family transcriptional regulator [Nocardiopsis suaedae]|uniref:Helix-turn-helix domain containing protein n=1 Tax=Nocardiopsis suaedae TaxID=3018444 RepID=A0ABT4TFZ9_9ACTN|nr:TetR/AcrR family transcriptional regulator [Nocardiopsis suaedae]MDA2803506.1 helix-turn-helix domain containing protein [Nocardiopsis suaedae]